MTDAETPRKQSLWERIFGPSCDHDWFDKDTAEKFVTRPDGTKICCGYVFIKECRKCHSIWAQHVP